MDLGLEVEPLMDALGTFWRLLTALNASSEKRPLWDLSTVPIHSMSTFRLSKWSNLVPWLLPSGTKAVSVFASNILPAGIYVLLATSLGNFVYCQSSSLNMRDSGVH